MLTNSCTNCRKKEDQRLFEATRIPVSARTSQACLRWFNCTFASRPFRVASIAFSCEGGAILFFAQTSDAATRDILNAANAFEQRFAERFRRDDALDKTTREFEAFVRRKFQNSFGKVG